MQLMPAFFTTADGLRHAYYELGGPGGGPVVILQHGFSATTADEWVTPGIAAALTGIGRRVIGIDALGHGASDHPHDPDAYGEQRMAHDIMALATHLHLSSYDLVGYSMGAIVALLTAIAETRIRRLAIGGVGEGVIVCGGVDRRVLDTDLLARGLRAATAEGFPPYVADFRAGIAQRGGDRLALAAHAERRHASPLALDRIDVPTLLLAGDSDPLAVRPEALAAAIAQCLLLRVPGDHTGARLSAEFTAALAAFLS